MFENSIFKIEFSILLGLFPHHNLYRLTFQSFVLREYNLLNRICINFDKKGTKSVRLWFRNTHSFRKRRTAPCDHQKS